MKTITQIFSTKELHVILDGTKTMFRIPMGGLFAVTGLGEDISIKYCPYKVGEVVNIMRCEFKIINIKLERLQEISKEDLTKEGLSPLDIYYAPRIVVFATLWDRQYKTESKYQWDRNPFVWVIEIEKK